MIKTNCPCCGAQDSIYIRLNAKIDFKLKLNGKADIPEMVDVAKDISFRNIDDFQSCFCGDCGADSVDDNDPMKNLLLNINR